MEKRGGVVGVQRVVTRRDRPHELAPSKRAAVVVGRHLPDEVGRPQSALDLIDRGHRVASHLEREIARGPDAVNLRLHLPEERDAERQVRNESLRDANLAAVVQV